MDDDKIFITCDCHGEALVFEEWEDGKGFPPTLMISLWEQGYSWKGLMFFERIKKFFSFMRRGPYTDSIIIEDREDLCKIIKYLNEMNKKMVDYEVKSAKENLK